MVQWTEAEWLAFATFNTALFCASLPLYIYGGVKWIQFRRHFLITKRFPAISNTIIVISFFNLSVGVVKRWINYHEAVQNLYTRIGLFGGINASLSFMTSGLIVYRLILVYIRWKKSKSQITISKMLHVELRTRISRSASIDSGNSKSTASLTTHIQQPDTAKSIYKHKVTFIVFSFVITASLYIAFSMPLFPNYMLLGMLWAFMIIFGICCCVLVLYHKVNEGIGLLFESYVSLLYTLCATIFTIVASLTDDRGHHYVSAYIRIALSPIQGLLPIYISLYFIRKCETSLHYKQWRDKFKSELYKKEKEIACNVSSVSADFVCNEDNEIKEDIDLNVECLVFLNEYENYQIFAKYLNHCFAVENLFFVERVSVIYWIINKYQVDLVEDYDDTQSKIQRLKFEYSYTKYKEYEDKINLFCCTTESYDVSGVKQLQFGSGNKDIEYYRKGFYRVYKEIYDEFIKTNAVHQVNLSSQTQESLIDIFSRKNGCKLFQTWDDFKVIWDNALVEVYQLLLNVYSYRFKEFVRNQN